MIITATSSVHIQLIYLFQAFDDLTGSKNNVKSYSTIQTVKLHNFVIRIKICNNRMKIAICNNTLNQPLNLREELHCNE